LSSNAYSCKPEKIDTVAEKPIHDTIIVLERKADQLQIISKALL
jgi:hypothetical protein